MRKLWRQNVNHKTINFSEKIDAGCVMRNIAYRFNLAERNAFQSRLTPTIAAHYLRQV